MSQMSFISDILEADLSHPDKSSKYISVCSTLVLIMLQGRLAKLMEEGHFRPYMVP